MKRWEDWERTRLRRIKRKERQRQQLESGAAHLTRLSTASEDDVSLIPPNLPYDDDESSSVTSSISQDLGPEQQYYDYSGVDVGNNSPRFVSPQSYNRNQEEYRQVYQPPSQQQQHQQRQHQQQQHQQHQQQRQRRTDDDLL